MFDNDGDDVLVAIGGDDDGIDMVMVAGARVVVAVVAVVAAVDGGKNG
jgi:hypothetical protein